MKSRQLSMIDAVVVHCAATRSNQYVDAAIIDRWHRQRGFEAIGYHYVIRRDAVVEVGRKLEIVGAHAKGFNSGSIGICLAGGIGPGSNGKAQANFTFQQYAALVGLITDLREGIPSIRSVVGHYELDSSKECPCFDVKALLEAK